MKWFEGGIAEAIAESRQKKALFIVNIQKSPESTDGNSQQMARLWDNIDNNICTPALIGIRIFEGTEPAIQFAQIYPVPVVPASYIIDLKGKPLDVIIITKELNEDLFLQRLKLAMKALNVVEESSSSTAVNEPIVEEKGEQQDTKLLSLEDKIKKARELLEKKHSEDEIEKRNEEQRKEIERRNLGKRMTEAKISREERERLEFAVQRKREKREQEAYLRRLREQIKADKEERMNGVMLNTAERKEKIKSTDQQTHLSSSSSNSVCRIQCKFRDGSTMVHHFSPTDSFSQLIELVRKDGRQGNDFSLVQMYPRREFPDATKTFAELSLLPSATIMVVSKYKRAVVNGYDASKWIELFFYAIVTPFQALYRMLLYLVGFNGFVDKSADKTNSGNVKPTSKTETAENDKEKQHSHIRKVGNIRRFHNEEDSSHSDDDEARWNGNSTQQL